MRDFGAIEKAHIIIAMGYTPPACTAHNFCEGLDDGARNGAGVLFLVYFKSNHM